MIVVPRSAWVEAVGVSMNAVEVAVEREDGVELLLARVRLSEQRYRVCIPFFQHGLAWWSVNETTQEVYHSELDEAPGLDLTSPSPLPAVARWQASIPPDIRDRVQALPFACDQFYFLRLASLSPAASELLRTNLLLFYLVARGAHANRLTLADVAARLRLRQHELLAGLGMVGARRAVKLLRRVVLPDPLFDHHMAHLERVLRSDDVIMGLAHEPRVDAHWLALAVEQPWLLGSPLARCLHQWLATGEQGEALSDADSGRVRRIAPLEWVRDTRAMLAQLDRDDQPLLACSTLRAVLRLHDRLVVEVNRLPAPSDDPVPFPDPPHPGTDCILPVPSAVLLQAHGRRMRHCVAAYAGHIRMKRYYVYGFARDGDPPVTIGVRVREGKITALDQAKGVANSQPPDHVLAIIQAWLVDAMHAS